MNFADFELGDLGKKMKSTFSKSKNVGLPEKDVWKYFIQICLGLNYIHKRKILHRDIKTINIFLTSENTVRIGDLGVAKVVHLLNLTPR